MDTVNIILFVFDSKDNYEQSKMNLGSEGTAFKKIVCVEDEKEFESEFKVLGDDELVFMVVHAFYTQSIKGLKRFVASRIERKYPSLGYMFISEGDSKEISKQMIDADIPYKAVYKYHQVQSNLEEEKFKVYRKQEVMQLASKATTSIKEKDAQTVTEEQYQYEYVIITALEEDEMEQVLPMITKQGEISSGKHLIEYGYLTANPQKKLVYASQQSTGMIDAAILATELLTMFKPKYLIMSGVLGGKPNELNIGDIIVSTKVFTIDKGKLTTQEIIETTLAEEKELNTDNKRLKVVESVFKREIESVSLNSAAITKFVRRKKDILSYINNGDKTRKREINLLFGPIACVRQVIDKKGFFEENVLVVDRKAIGLEMESYGIARACELANDGLTTPIIVKAVMDNTVNKGDEAKTYASWTSAMFVKYVLENNLI